MIGIIETIIIAIFNLLPNSPFRSIIDGVIYDVDFLPTLNWFLPFDVCATMSLAWLDCILAYYLFVMVKKIVYDFVLEKIMSAISVGIGALSEL